MKKYWKSQGILSEKKSGNPEYTEFRLQRIRSQRTSGRSLCTKIIVKPWLTNTAYNKQFLCIFLLAERDIQCIFMQYEVRIHIESRLCF